MGWGYLRLWASGLAPAFFPEPPVPKPLRHHWSTLVVTLPYIVLLTLPWIATCILNVKPTLVGKSSYMDNPAEYLKDGGQSIIGWIYAIKVMTALNAALAVPLVSAVLAHAAVAVVQRTQAKQPIQLRHFLNVSDASWMRVPGRERSRSKFVIVATALILLSIINPPLQYALTSFETIQMASCMDGPYAYRDDVTNHCTLMSYDDPTYTVVGFDPEPFDLVSAPARVVMQRVASSLATTNLYDRQPYAWPEPWGSTGAGGGSAAGTFSEYYEGSNYNMFYLRQAGAPVPYFVSALPKGTSTGVLREHAVRMNSTASCDMIAAGTYPADCSGEKPFTGIYSVTGLTIRFCLPGNYTTVPWSTSRDMDTIVESFYIDIQVGNTSALLNTRGGGIFTDMTVSCVATSTRGYFELPNNWNNNTAGPLLETWLTQQELQDDFNDYTREGDAPSKNSSTGGDLFWPSSPYDTDNDYRAAGPLAISILAMLGNTSSWFPTAVSAASSTDTTTQRDALFSLCNYTIPFGSAASEAETWRIFDSFGDVSTICAKIDDYLSFNRSTVGDLITRIVYQWFASFGSNSTSQDSNKAPQLAGDGALGVAMYFANEALLTTTAAAGTPRYGGARQIFASPGTTVTKPSVSVPAEIVVSVFLGIEVLALLALLGYIYGVPTIGSRFDAVTILAIGARLKDAMGANLPKLGLVDRRALTRLEDVDVREAFLLDGGVGIELQVQQPRSDEELVGDADRCSEDTVVDPDAPVRRTGGA